MGFGPINIGTVLRYSNEASGRFAAASERLSSGSRITRASDDAAGLAIASGLSSRARIAGQSIRNLNDGASATNIADGAMSELSNILSRLGELAEQAANGTVSAVQRTSLNTEAQALVSEFKRIGSTTEFNGKSLLDGNYSGVGLSIDGSSANAISLGFANYSTGLGSVTQNLPTGTFQAGITTVTGGFEGGVATGDLDGDGDADLLKGYFGNGSGDGFSVFFSNGNGTFLEGQYVATGTITESPVLRDINGDGKLDAIMHGQFSMFVSLGNGNGTFTATTSYLFGDPVQYLELHNKLDFADFNGDGFQDAVIAGRNGGVSYLAGNGNGTFKAVVSIATGVTGGGGNSSIGVGDFNGDGKADIGYSSDTAVSILLGTGSGTFTVAGTSAGTSGNVLVGDFDRDGRAEIVVESRRITVSAGGAVAVTSSISDNFNTSAVADLNGDGILDILSTEVRIGNGDGTFKGGGQSLTGGIDLALGDFNNDGALDAVYDFGDVYAFRVFLGNSAAVTTGVTVDLSTAAKAQQSLDGLRGARDGLAIEQGKVGALMSRINSALSTVGVQQENYVAAAARIQDVDVAFEAAELVRNQILQRAGTAVLAQANQNAGLLLRLFKSDSTS